MSWVANLLVIRYAVQQFPRFKVVNIDVTELFDSYLANGFLGALVCGGICEDGHAVIVELICQLIASSGKVPGLANQVLGELEERSRVLSCFIKRLANQPPLQSVCK